MIDLLCESQNEALLSLLILDAFLGRLVVTNDLVLGIVILYEMAGSLHYCQGHRIYCSSFLMKFSTSESS